MSCDYNACYFYRSGTPHTHYREDAMKDENPPVITCRYCEKEGRAFTVTFDIVGAESMKAHLHVIHKLVGTTAITPDL